jgi:hypothetical protein
MTMRRSYELRGVDAGLAQHLHELVRFSTGPSVRVVESDACGLTVEAEDEHTLGYLDELFDDARASTGKLRSKVVWENRPPRTGTGDVDAELAARGDVHEFGAGLTGMRGLALQVFHFFEREFRALAAAYDADEERYPAMMPLALLEEVGYLAHFPQHVTFCSHFPEDLRLLEAVSGAVETNGGTLSDDHRAAVGLPAHVLTPAVCLPCYGQRRNRIVRPEGERAVTMQNHVFRYEGRNCRSFARCWDFTVRDIVFFGASDHLSHLREEVMRRVSTLCERLELEGRIELANDPFFLGETRDKRIYQRMGEVKYELVLALPRREEMLAVSSFNLHRGFYCSTYDIRLPDGEYAESACMGFGLDRWTYAFLSQHGTDPRRWPEVVARAVAAETA